MKENIADLFTKSFPQKCHHFLLRKLNIVDSSIMGEYCDYKDT